MWRDQRRLVASSLRSLGMVKTGSRRDRLEARIQRGVAKALEDMRAGGAAPEGLDPHAVVADTVGNVVNDVVFGRTWATDDPTWQWLQRIQDEGVKLIGVAGPINFLPFLRILPNFSRSIRWLKEGQVAQHKLYADLVRAMQSRLDDEGDQDADEQDSILAAWLQERRRQVEAKSPDAERIYSDRQLFHLLADLFGAGLDTTVTTLRWFLLMMMAHPAAQKRVQQELDEVLGERPPCLDDMGAMPYTMAAIAETQRIRSVTPLGIPHGAREDTVLAGYHIPRGTMIVPLQWAMHMDPARWVDPDTFRPERFIGEDGSLLRPEGFIPFQTGKRMCVGEDWAKMMLFLFGAGILQQLSLELPDGQGPPDLEGVSGLTLSPKHHRMRCIPRSAASPAPLGE